MPLQTKALTLREAPCGENDRLITVLSEQEGLFRAFVRGARKTKSSKQSATGLFVFAQMEIDTRRDRHIVLDAQPLEVFFGLREAPERVALAAYLGDLAAAVCPEGVPAPEALRLLLNGLHFLSRGTRPQLLIKAAAETGLLNIAGFRPDLSIPDGTPGPRLWLNGAGGSLSWTRPAQTALALDPETLPALRFFFENAPGKVLNADVPISILKRVNAVTEQYFECQTGKTFHTRHFYYKMAE